jgi:hypothetical protein
LVAVAGPALKEKASERTGMASPFCGLAALGAGPGSISGIILRLHFLTRNAMGNETLLPKDPSPVVLFCWGKTLSRKQPNYPSSTKFSSQGTKEDRDMAKPSK